MARPMKYQQEKKLFDQFELIELRKEGWDFYQVGPNEWSWLKFNVYGECKAKQGDGMWKDVLKMIERRRDGFPEAWHIVP